MQDVNVVVVFWWDDASGAAMAQAAALGAVQARANIRLRRISAPEGQTAASHPDPDAEYIAPRDSDVAWADAILVITPPEKEARSRDLTRSALPDMARAERKLHAVTESSSDAYRLQGSRIAQAARDAKQQRL